MAICRMEPGSITSVGGNKSWQGLGNIMKVDGSYAYLRVNTNNDEPGILRMHGPYKQFPRGIKLNGFEVKLTRRQTKDQNYIDHRVQLAVDGNYIGLNMADPGKWSTSWQTVTYGSPTNLWGINQDDLIDPVTGILRNCSFDFTLTYYGKPSASEFQIDAIEFNMYFEVKEIETYFFNQDSSFQVNMITKTATMSGNDQKWVNLGSLALDDQTTTTNVTLGTALDLPNRKVNHLWVPFGRPNEGKYLAELSGIEVTIVRMHEKQENNLDGLIALANMTTKTDISLNYAKSEYWSTQFEWITYGGPGDTWGLTTSDILQPDRKLKDNLGLHIKLEPRDVDNNNLNVLHIYLVTCKYHFTNTENGRGILIKVSPRVKYNGDWITPEAMVKSNSQYANLENGWETRYAE